MSPNEDSPKEWASTQQIRLTWQEDEACRTAGDNSREMLDQAWKRLYGEELPNLADAIDVVDHGDCMMRLFPHGRIIEQSYMGDAIYETRRPGEATTEDSVHVDPDTASPASAPSAPIGSNYQVDGRELSTDQGHALDKVFEAIERGQRVVVLTGPAGTGKTTCARALEAKLHNAGWLVEYMAPTGKAAVRISEVTRRRATTIHSRLFTRVTNTEDGIPIFSEPQQLTSMGRTVFICDEGSMVGTRIHEQILDHLGPGNAIVYLADPFQLPPVADSWGPDLLHPTAELTQIHRQAEESPILRVATRLRNREPMPKESLDQGYTRRNGTLDEAARWMVQQIKAKEDAIVLCYSNKTRQQINHLVRRLLGYDVRGPLCLDERLLVLRNNPAVGRMNGETMVAEKIRWLHTPKEGVVVVQSGDTSFFTKPDLMGAERTAFEYHSQMGNRVGADHRAWLHLDYAYCLTVHKSQGSEYRKVLFVVDGTMRAMWRSGRLQDGYKLCYTAVTRARDELIILDTK